MTDGERQQLVDSYYGVEWPEPGRHTSWADSQWADISDDVDVTDHFANEVWMWFGTRYGGR